LLDSPNEKSTGYNENGGGGGSRTRVRKYSTVGVYILSPVWLFIVPRTLQDKGCATLSCQDFAVRTAGAPGRLSRCATPFPAPRERAGRTAASSGYSVSIVVCDYI